MSLRKIHCCYIIISTEFKEKHTLEQHELFCCVIVCSGIKENKVLCTKTKECRKKKSFSLSPPREPWTPSSLWALDSLSTNLRINSVTYTHIYIKHLRVYSESYILLTSRNFLKKRKTTNNSSCIKVF